MDDAMVQDEQSLVRDYSCLCPRERQISVAYATPDTHNVLTGTGFQVLRHKSPY